MANGDALMRCLPQSLTWLRGMKCTRILAQKNAGRLWIAVDRTGKRFLKVVIGDQSTDTGQCLREGVAQHDIPNVMTDDWQHINAFFLVRYLHSQKPKRLPLKAITAYSDTA